MGVHTTVATAEMIGGPMDGVTLPRLPGMHEWPEFRDFGLESKHDRRRVLYRFEPLASGAAQYVFDRRYNR